MADVWSSCTCATKSNTNRAANPNPKKQIEVLWCWKWANHPWTWALKAVKVCTVLVYRLLSFCNPKLGSLHTFPHPPPLSPLPVPLSVTTLSAGSCPFTLILPFIKSPTSRFFYNLVTPLSATLALSPYHLLRRPLSFTVTPLPGSGTGKGQRANLRSPVFQGLRLICINLHNFVKAAGDAVHTVPWDT